MKTRNGWNRIWSRRAVVVLAVGALAHTAAAQSYCSVERASVATGGAEGNQPSGRCDVDASGRYVVFDSAASNLVPGDTNGQDDVFVRDRVSGVTERSSVSTAGAQAAGFSGGPSISDDGRYVIFSSDAANLVTGDTNGAFDVFLRDRVLSTTVRVSLGPSDVQLNGDSGARDISGDGFWIAFDTAATNLGVPDSNGWFDPYVRHRVSGALELLAPALGGGTSSDGAVTPRLSFDGRYAAFASPSTDLVAGKTVPVTDVFVRDRTAGTTSWVSQSLTGGQADDLSFVPVVSDDGRFVAFETNATDMQPVAAPIGQIVRRDRMTNGIDFVSAALGGGSPDGGAAAPEISGDGRYVQFTSMSTNLVQDPSFGGRHLYLRDCAAGSTERRNLRADGSTEDSGAKTAFHAMTRDAAIPAWSDSARRTAPADHNGVADVFVRDCARNFSLLCAGKINTQGCMPALTATGDTSLSSPAPFTLSATQVVNQTVGIYLYSFGCASMPFHGGTLCLTTPKRLAPVGTGGNPLPKDCSGALVLDVKPLLQGFMPGTRLYLQGYYRDGLAQPSLTGLTQGLELQVAP